MGGWVEWSVAHAQTQERGPPSAPAEIFYTDHGTAVVNSGMAGGLFG